MNVTPYTGSLSLCFFAWHLYLYYHSGHFMYKYKGISVSDRAFQVHILYVVSFLTISCKYFAARDFLISFRSVLFLFPLFIFVVVKQSSNRFNLSRKIHIYLLYSVRSLCIYWHCCTFSFCEHFPNYINVLHLGGRKMVTTFSINLLFSNCLVVNVE